MIDLYGVYHENRPKALGLLPCGNHGGKLPSVSLFQALLIKLWT